MGSISSPPRMYWGGTIASEYTLALLGAYLKLPRSFCDIVSSSGLTGRCAPGNQPCQCIFPLLAKSALGVSLGMATAESSAPTPASIRVLVAVVRHNDVGVCAECVFW